MNDELTGLAARLQNWWRKQKRSPYYTDLRLIALEHRARYRENFRSGNCGTVIGTLLLAHRNGHFVSQRATARNEGTQP